MTMHWDEKIASHIAQQQRDRELHDGSEGLPDHTWAEMLEHGEVRFKDQIIAMEKRPLFEGQLDISLPKDLAALPKAMLEREGKPRHRDQVLFINDREELTCGLRWLEQVEETCDLELLKACMMIAAKGEKPEIRLFELEDERLRQMNMETYDCLISTERGLIYQMIFLTIFKERVLMGSFQFKAEQAAVWRPLFAAVIKSLHFN